MDGAGGFLLVGHWQADAQDQGQDQADLYDRPSQLPRVYLHSNLASA